MKSSRWDPCRQRDAKCKGAGREPIGYLRTRGWSGWSREDEQDSDERPGWGGRPSHWDPLGGFVLFFEEK